VKEFLARAVAGLEVDYADIRYEENRKTRITFQGSRLDEIAEYSASGSHIRVYDRGGKSTASISDPEHIERVPASLDRGGNARCALQCAPF
jgi:predicted Zn-dependent protease